MRRAGRRVDRNHAEIRDALRKCGWLVYDASHVGDGFPDLVCIKAGRVVFTEVKDGEKVPSARQLTHDEKLFHDAFRRHGAEVVVVESLRDLAQFERPL